MGGLDWTGTALGRAFKSQEQVLFLFAAILLIISVTLHMLSIPEQPFSPSHQLKTTGSGESTGQFSFRAIGQVQRSLDMIAEEDASLQERQEHNKSDPEEGEIDFLAVDRVRSKSDSVLAMPDATIKLDPDLDPDAQVFLPDVDRILLGTQGELDDAFMPSNHSTGSSSPPFLPASPSCGTLLLNDQMPELEPISPTLPELHDQTDDPRPPLLTISPCLEDTQQNTKVMYSCHSCRWFCVGLRLFCCQK